jgi:hypothetical protein
MMLAVPSDRRQVVRTNSSEPSTNVTRDGTNGDVPARRSCCDHAIDLRRSSDCGYGRCDELTGDVDPPSISPCQTPTGGQMPKSRRTSCVHRLDTGMLSTRRWSVLNVIMPCPLWCTLRTRLGLIKKLRWTRTNP